MPGSPVYFAVDNCDFRNDTPDGKNEFHGTAQIVYQQFNNVSAPSKLKVERNQKRALSKDPFPPAATCSKPIPPNQRHPSFVPDRKDVDLYRKWDSIWFLTKSLKEEGTENNTPTWAAYNSLITKALPVTIFCGIPLYPAPPTDWTNLYAALQICQNISTITYPAGKTIISLDLQLYSKALQLQSRKEVNCNFVFRPGELHIVFAFLHAIGIYIEGSGIDQVFVDANVYGCVTVEQIMKGTHMKRGMEAYTTLYLTFHKLYLKEFFNKFPHMEEKLSSLLSSYLGNFDESDTFGHLRCNHDDVLNLITGIEIFEFFERFDGQLHHQPRFLRNCMQMYEILLLFVRATRQDIWNLRLTSLELMIPYFFAHDLQNYARLIPEYLAQMYESKEKDNQIWEFFKKKIFSKQK